MFASVGRLHSSPSSPFVSIRLHRLQAVRVSTFPSPHHLLELWGLAAIAGYHRISASSPSPMSRVCVCVMDANPLQMLPSAEMLMACYRFVGPSAQNPALFISRNQASHVEACVVCSSLEVSKESDILLLASFGLPHLAGTGVFLINHLRGAAAVHVQPTPPYSLKCTTFIAMVTTWTGGGRPNHRCEQLISRWDESRSSNY